MTFRKKVLITVFISLFIFLTSAYGIWRINNLSHLDDLSNEIPKHLSSAESASSTYDALKKREAHKFTSKQELPALYYQYKEGDHYRYKLDYNMAFDVGLDIGVESDKKDASLNILGELNVIVYKKTGSKFILGYFLDDPKVIISGDARQTATGDPKIIERALMEEVLVEMSLFGRIESLIFPKTVRPDIRNMLKGIVAASQVVFPNKPKKEWKKNETDITGEYIAEYQLDFVEKQPYSKINKRKIQYVSLSEESGVIKDFLNKIDIRDSEINAQFNIADGYIRDMHFDETIEIKLGNYQVSQFIGSRIRFNMELLSKGKNLGYAKSDQAEERINILKTMGESTVLLGLEGEDFFERRRYERILAGKTLQDLFNTLDKLEIKDDEKLRFRIMDQLEAFMYLYPERIHEITEKVLQSKDGNNTISTITAAMETVPHLEAQEGLKEIIIKRRKDKDTLLLTIPSLGAVPNPLPESEALLWDLYRNERDHDISTTSLLAVGVMGDTLQSIDNQRSIKIVEQISDVLLQARSTEDKIPPLEALGNAGNPDIIEVLDSYSLDDDDKIRSLAIESMRKISDQQVVNTIKRALIEDESEIVRYAAACVSETRFADKEFFSILKEAYMSEESEMVRAQTLRSIWKNKAQFPEAVDIVKDAESKDPSENIRSFATSLILTSDMAQ